jgi:single-strand DNA-binding protein
MARGINKVILIGNLGADPETRYTKGGTPVTSFRVATSESWRDKESGQTEERTEWHRISTFGRLAEITGEYLRKGSKVYVEGSLRTSSWDGQDGQKRFSTEIVARDVQMLDSRGAGMGGGAPAREGALVREGRERAGAGGGRDRDEGAFEPAAGGSDFDDDIPF